MTPRIQILVDMLDERNEGIKKSDRLSTALQLTSDLITFFDEYPELDQISKSIAAHGNLEKAPIAAQLEEIITWLESGVRIRELIR